MATVRPSSLPAAASVASGDAFIVDNGATVEKATPGQIVDAAIPLASQAEAEAGADNVKRVTPLRVKQAMDANMATTDALASTAPGKGDALVGSDDGASGSLWTTVNGFIAYLRSAAGSTIVGFLQSGTGAVARTLSAKLFGYVDVEDFGAVGDGVTDDTTAWTNAIAYVSTRALRLRAMSPTYLVSILTFTGSNYSVETNGCLFKQVPGTVADATGPASPVRFIGGSNITIGDFRVQGNIATDEGEANHAVSVGKTSNIKIGRVYGTDIRGDVIYCYGRNTSEAERLKNIYIESVSGTNIFRNLVSFVGGQVRVGSIVHDGPVGFRDFDVEPNDASGTYEAADVEIGYAKIGTADITSNDAAVINNAVRIGILDADNSRVAATTPAYTSPPGTGAYALAVNRTNTVEIGHFKARNYNTYALSPAASWSHVNIGTFDIANCSLTDATYNTMILQQGNAGNGIVRIGNLICDAANTKYLARVVGTGLLKIEVNSITLMKCMPGVQISGRFANGEIDLNGSTGVALANSTGVVFDNVTTANYASATFTSGCANIIGFNSALFEATRREVSLPIGGGVYNAGVKVLGSQGATVADPTGGTTIDSECRTAVTALISRLQAHGLIA